MLSNTVVKIGLIDDHVLFRKGLVSLIEAVGSRYKVMLEANNGLDLQNKISKNDPPDLVLMDVNMPGINGFASVEWMKIHYPLVNILVVSMIEKEETIVKMLRLGVKGYLCKDVEPKELSEALEAVVNKGFYFTDFITGKLVHSLQNDHLPNTKEQVIKKLNDRELQFLQLACTELTYAEIAAKMYLSPKTIDGYRNALFEKLNAKSRVGLAMFAVRHGIVEL